jgi:hypothetical protein
VWITPAASGAVAPDLISQARLSLGPAVRKVCRPSARNPARGQLGQAGLAQARLGQQLGGLVLAQLGQIGFGLGVEDDHLSRGDQRGQLLTQVLVAKLGHIYVEHVQGGGPNGIALAGSPVRSPE